MEKNLTTEAGQIQVESGRPEQNSIRLPTASDPVRLAVLYRSLKESRFSQRICGLCDCQLCQLMLPSFTSWGVGTAPWTASVYRAIPI